MYMCITPKSHGNIHSIDFSFIIFLLFRSSFVRMATSLVSPSATYHAQYFVTGDSKGSIRLWDINDFQKVPIFRPKNSIRGPGNIHLISFYRLSIDIFKFKKKDISNKNTECLHRKILRFY